MWLVPLIGSAQSVCVVDVVCVVDAVCMVVRVVDAVHLVVRAVDAVGGGYVWWMQCVRWCVWWMQFRMRSPAEYLC